MSKLPENLDGMDMWPTLSGHYDDIRKSILHNIDDLEKTWAVRSNNMKLLWGAGGMIENQSFCIAHHPDSSPMR